MCQTRESEFLEKQFDIRFDDSVLLELTQWNFDVFKHHEESLSGLVKQMFVHLDLLG
jgi:hypothetical protein